MVGYKNPPNRSDSPYPWLTCTNCGKTKRATRFPRRGGPTYEKLRSTDPRRYDKQCKLCKKPRPANAGPDYEHKEPKAVQFGGKHKKKKKETEKAASRRLSRREKKQRVRIETRIKSMLYASKKGCHECGERDPRKLEYDHKNPADKHRGISRLITDGFSWASPVLRAEIRKCRILCANCHRVHTIKQQGYFASDDVQRTLGEIAGRYGFDI